MSHKILVSRFFTIPVHELYGYFIDPVLVKKWCAPEGFTVKEVHMDVREGGRYTYSHSNKDGIHTCLGHFRKIIQNELIQSVDDEIRDPKGNLMAANLATEMKFASFGTGSGVEILVSGFSQEAFAKECETGWNQCLDKLQDIVKDSGIRQFRTNDREQRNSLS